MRKTTANMTPATRRATVRDNQGKFLKQAAVQPMTPIEAASPTASIKQISANQAYDAMVKGQTVQRIDPNSAFGKFHRLHNGELQTADTADKMMEGDWHRARTDVASWYASTFAVVTVKVVQVQLVYT